MERGLPQVHEPDQLLQRLQRAHPLELHGEDEGVVRGAAPGQHLDVFLLDEARGCLHYQAVAVEVRDGEAGEGGAADGKDDVGTDALLIGRENGLITG